MEMDQFASAAQRAASKKMGQARIPRDLALNAMVAEIDASLGEMLGEVPRLAPLQDADFFLN